MAVIRRRLLFWLIKAYIKKSGKIIVFSFFVGLTIFFLFLFGSQYMTKFIPVEKKTTIGIVGAYPQDQLPPIVLDKISRGLTSVQEDGSISPALAASWTEKDNGKIYEFKLKPNQHFTNGELVTSDKIAYNFSDVTVEKPDKSTIIYKLKDAYSPFLVTVAKPVFIKGFTGAGEYKISDIKLNGNFVQSLTLTSNKNRFDQIRFRFYPTEEALKMAFILGEVSQAVGLNNTQHKESSFASFPNTKIEQKIDQTRLVTLFYNTTDDVLSDKKFRTSLTYALPNDYSNGRKTYMPYVPESIYYNNDVPARTQDYEHAKTLLESSASSASATPILNIKTLKKYRTTADAIAASWKNIGIKTSIEEVDSIPTKFQVYLGEFNLPKDPDQYALWHSSQVNNITKYKNLRIDKLLEDGRKTADQPTRQKLYQDFQKYLVEDAPASFLYFPYVYEVVRK